MDSDRHAKYWMCKTNFFAILKTFSHSLRVCRIILGAPELTPCVAAVIFPYADQIEETLTRSPCASEAFTYAKRIMTRPLPKLQTDFFRAAQWKKQPPNGVYEIGYLLNYKCYDVKGPPNGWLLGWQSSQIFWRTPTMMNCQIMFNPLLNPMKSHYRFHWITTRAIKIPWKIDRT